MVPAVIYLGMATLGFVALGHLDASILNRRVMKVFTTAIFSNESSRSICRCARARSDDLNARRRPHLERATSSTPTRTRTSG